MNAPVADAPLSVPIPVEEPKDDRRQFLTFVVTGGCAAVVNVGARALFSVALPFEAAVAAAYLVGMTTAFLLARRFVFAAGGPWWREYVKFAAVNVVAFLQVLVVSDLFDRAILPWLHWVWRRELLAHGLGVASPIMTSYYAHKHFSFRRMLPKLEPTA